jgi:hypothetical protein
MGARLDPVRKRLLKATSIVVLAVLAGLPVNGTICAANCLPSTSSASTAGGHHAGTTHDHGVHGQQAPPSGQTGVRGTAGHTGHDCPIHDRAIGDAVADLTEGRAYGRVLQVSQFVVPATSVLLGSESSINSTGLSPPGQSASPPRPPLVLRI